MRLGYDMSAIAFCLAARLTGSPDRTFFSVTLPRFEKEKKRIYVVDSDRCRRESTPVKMGLRGLDVSSRMALRVNNEAGCGRLF